MGATAQRAGACAGSALGGVAARRVAGGAWLCAAWRQRATPQRAGRRGARPGAGRSGRCFAPTSLRGSPRGRAAQLTSLAALASFRHSAASQMYEARSARRPRGCAARRRRKRCAERRPPPRALSAPPGALSAPCAPAQRCARPRRPRGARSPRSQRCAPSSSSAMSAITGAWSDGCSRLRGSRSMRQPRTAGASACGTRMWSMRSPALRRNASCR